MLVAISGSVDDIITENHTVGPMGLQCISYFLCQHNMDLNSQSSKCSPFVLLHSLKLSMLVQ